MTTNCKARQRIENSKTYIGHRTYQHDAVHLTPAGVAAGWEYKYPVGISRGGVNVYDSGLSLELLIEQGLADWHTATTTCC